MVRKQFEQMYDLKFTNKHNTERGQTVGAGVCKESRDRSENNMLDQTMNALVIFSSKLANTNERKYCQDVMLEFDQNLFSAR